MYQLEKQFRSSEGKNQFNLSTTFSFNFLKGYYLEDLEMKDTKLSNKFVLYTEEIESVFKDNNR